ncbi:MAG: phospho-N-acetylmuramoyl-pentapeptide-transferase [Chlamydiae bacterium]|nr:phospho-N-acetylmuramoyl-pentapeptide-transferase [Chlamydiota bacterium]
MIFYLFQFLTVQLGWKIPSVFTYSSTRMILAALTTLLFTIFLGPRFIKKLYEMKIGQSIRVEDCPLLGQLHEKKKDTPTMGGILLLSSMVLSLFLWMNWKSSFTLVLLVTTVWLGFIGGYDDYLKLKRKSPKGMSAKTKFLLQNTLSILLALYFLCPSLTAKVQVGDYFAPPSAKELNVGKDDKPATIQTLSTQAYMTRYYVPFWKDPVVIFSGFLLFIPFLFSIFIITGSSNAVNLTDGLDGLASGCLLFVAVVLSIVAFLSNNIEISRYLHILYIEDSGEIAVYLCALFGACLGFLWYNGYPAQVFMGDTGSLALGGIIGVCALLLRREALLGIVGGIFVAEAASVILQVGSYKLRNKKRIFLCSPLHHHFEYKGWPETKVVLRFWIVGLILAIIGLASLKFQ